MEFEIKITGSGSRRDLIGSLGRLLNSLRDQTHEDLEEYSFEDPTIYAETKALEDSDAF